MRTLSVITGPPASLDAALAAEIRTHKSTTPLAPITVLVGGSLLRPFLRARLATLLDGHINVPVLSPADLALRPGERAPPAAELARRRGQRALIAADRSPITPLADRAVAQELARAATTYFEPVRETPGFANALHRLFGELRAPALAPPHAASPPARPPSSAAGAGRAGPAAPRLDDHAVLVHGIWEIPARLRTMLEQIAQRLPVTVLLPTTGSSADDVHKPVRDWLAAHDAPVRELDPPASPKDALGALRTRLFLDTPERAPEDSTVALV